MFFIDKYYDKKYGKIKLAALRGNKNLYTGKTHADCFIQEPKGVLKLAEQGFITEKGIFVDRKLALKIAKHYKQIEEKHPPKNILLSEDFIKIERR